MKTFLIGPGQQTDHAERPGARTTYGRADYDQENEDDQENLGPKRKYFPLSFD